MNPAHATAIDAAKSGRIPPIYCDDAIEEYVIHLGQSVYIVTYWHDTGQYHVADYHAAMMT